MTNKLFIVVIIITFLSCQKRAKEQSEEKNKQDYAAQHNNHRKGGNRTAAAGIYTNGDTVYVPEDNPVSMKLRTETVHYRDFNAPYTTTGVVKPLSGRRAEITALFDGRIVKSFTKLGQKVSVGTPLFEVISSDYLEYVKMFLQANHEKELAEKNYLRKKDLHEKGISSGKEFDEAKLEYENAVKEHEKTTSIMKLLNLASGEADLSQPLIIRSPIKGEVVRTDFTVGQFVKADAAPAVIVADLNTVWVVASVKEKDLGSISLKDYVEIFTESRPDSSMRGSVNYIGDIMNPETRSVEVYIECPNPQHIFKCGMFVTVRFYHTLKNAIIVPESSVLQDHDMCYLFVPVGKGKYIKRRVEVTSAGGKMVNVHNGIEAGQTIVTEGGIYLR